jgi:hypothetical protein
VTAPASKPTPKAPAHLPPVAVPPKAPREPDRLEGFEGVRRALAARRAGPLDDVRQVTAFIDDFRQMDGFERYLVRERLVASAQAAGDAPKLRKYRKAELPECLRLLCAEAFPTDVAAVHGALNETAKTLWARAGERRALEARKDLTPAEQEKLARLCAERDARKAAYLDLQDLRTAMSRCEKRRPLADTGFLVESGPVSGFPQVIGGTARLGIAQFPKDARTGKRERSQGYGFADGHLLVRKGGGVLGTKDRGLEGGWRVPGASYTTGNPIRGDVVTFSPFLVGLQAAKPDGRYSGGLGFSVDLNPAWIPFLAGVPGFEYFPDYPFGAINVNAIVFDPRLTPASRAVHRKAEQICDAAKRHATRAYRKVRRRKPPAPPPADPADPAVLWSDR